MPSRSHRRTRPAALFSLLLTVALLSCSPDPTGGEAGLGTGGSEAGAERGATESVAEGGTPATSPPTEDTETVPPSAAGLPDVPPLSPEVDGLDETVVSIDVARGEVRVDAKVADTDAERRQGLMGVPELPPGVGMLFVFPDERRGGFWMKDTLVPLDIAFVGSDGVVLEILSMQPCTTDPCPVHDPGVDYRYALEVPEGWFAANGVEAGDTVRTEEVTPAG